MERLTEKHYLAEDHYMKCSEDCSVDMDCVDCPAFDKLVERLAAYEDTGLTPEEIKAPFTEDAMINLAAQALGVEPSRLREFAEADKAGRCVVLPCKVGANMIDKIFKDCPRLMKNVRPAIVYVRKGVIYNMALETFEGAVSEGLIIPASEEAEKALAEREGKKDG